MLCCYDVMCDALYYCQCPYRHHGVVHYCTGCAHVLMQLIRVPHDPEISQIQRPQIRRPSDLGTSDFGGVRFWTLRSHDLTELVRTWPNWPRPVQNHVRFRGRNVPCQRQTPIRGSYLGPPFGPLFGTPFGALIGTAVPLNYHQGGIPEMPVLG